MLNMSVPTGACLSLRFSSLPPSPRAQRKQRCLLAGVSHMSLSAIFSDSFYNHFIAYTFPTYGTVVRHKFQLTMSLT